MSTGMLRRHYTERSVPVEDPADPTVAEDVKPVHEEHAVEEVPEEVTEEVEEEDKPEVKRKKK